MLLLQMVLPVLVKLIWCMVELQLEQAALLNFHLLMVPMVLY
jgi:hypothetical protein